MTRLNLVRAAGGALWRVGEGGMEVLLVHRSHYDDWTLPKGKCDPGETDEQCACREVEEETGLTGCVGPELPPQRYVDDRGREKAVRYWAMTVAGGDGVLRHEVDEVAWLLIPEAKARLTHPLDAAVLVALEGAVGDQPTCTRRDG